MELETSSFMILFAFFCIFLVLAEKLSNFKNPKSIRNLPPGPWKLPLIGNIHQMINGSLPHHTLRNLAKKHGPFMHLQLGETSNLIVSSAEIAKEIMKTHDAIFANRPHLLAIKIILYDGIEMLISPYGTHWSQLRRLSNSELLSPKRVESFRLIREEEISAMIKKISTKEGSVINLSEMLLKLPNDITARVAFGRKCKDQEAFLKLSAQTIEMGTGFSVCDLYPSIKILPVITRMKAKAEKVHRGIDRILENIIVDHKEKKKRDGEAEEDFVDVLLKLQHQNDLDVSLSYDNVKALILDIFIGGTDTSTTTIEWTMAELMRNPKAMEDAQAEVRRALNGKGHVDETDLHQLKFLKSVIKESLRLHPPVPLLMPRENTERCVINGYEIPAKTRVIINAWAIGRDLKYWTEPEVFKPERFIDNETEFSFRGTHLEYIPFGSGRRVCPGISFAMPIIELALANLLYHFDWKLPNGMKHEDLDMTEKFAMSAFRKVDLYLIPIRHNP